MQTVRNEHHGAARQHGDGRAQGARVLMTRPMLSRLAALAFVVTLGSVARAQGNPLDDMLTSAKKSLEVFDYRRADSISRTVLAFGSVLSKPQRVLALQILIGASYPEEQPHERRTEERR